jgi:hypothetical protein
LLFIAGYLQIAAAEMQLGGLIREKADLDRQLLTLDEDAKRTKAVEDWSANEVNWLDELYDLVDRFPEPTTVRLVRLTANPATRTSKGKSYPAKMELSGITTDDTEAVVDLQTAFVSEGTYRTTTIDTNRNLGPDRLQRFTQSFKMPIDVEKRAAEKYRRRLSVSAPPEEEKPAGGMDVNLFDLGGQ